MSNWRYANVTPTKEWRSALTIPRVIALKTTEEGVRLVQNPIRELQGLRVENISIQNEVVVPGVNLLSNVNSNTFEIIAEFEMSSATEFGFKVCKGSKEETIIGYDVKNKDFFVDRTNSGEASFHDSFAGKHDSNLISQKMIKFHIFVDRSSIELFGNDGESVITDLIFPNEENKQMELFVKNGEVKLHSLELYILKSIWR
jgi:fructan beta-fructosidase